MKGILAVFLVLFLSACSLKPDFNKSPTINKYLIKKPNLKESQNKIQQVIKIANPVAPSYMLTKKIEYSTSSGSHESYAYSFWDETPVRQMQFLLAFSLNKKFKNVLIAPTRANFDLEFESRIEEFEFDYTNSRVSLILRVFLINSSHDIIKSKTFKISSNVKQENPKGVVEAYSQVIQILSEQILTWLDK